MATNVTVTRVYANPDHFQGKNTPQYVYSGAASSQGGGIQWLGSTLNAVGTYTAPGYITANDDMLWDGDLLSLGTKLTAAKQAADVVVQVGSVTAGAHGAVEIVGNQIINGTIGTLSFHNEASAHARNTVAELAVTRVGDADSGQITLKLADSDANLDDVYIVSELFHNWAVAGVSEMWLSDAALYPNTVGGLTLGTSGAPWGAAFAASALLTGMATTGNRMVYADSTGLLTDLSWLTWSGAGTLEIGTGLTFANFDFEYGGANPYSFSADAANGLYIHEYSTNIAKFTTALVTVVSPVRMDDLAGTGDRFIFADADGDIGDHAWFTAPATGTIEIGTGLTASSLAFEYGGTNPYELSANATDGMYIHLYSDKIMHFTDALITTVVAVRMDSLAGTGDRMVVADADGDLSTQAIPVVDPMVYPGAGIPLSTGTAWDTSITDNSATWNAAQPGHANLTSLSGLTYVSSAFAKMTAAGTFTLDTTTYSEQTLSLGTANQIPHMTGTTDFTYTTGFTFDGTTFSVPGGLFAPALTEGTGGDYILTWDAATGEFIYDNDILITGAPSGIRFASAASTLSWVGTGTEIWLDGSGNLTFKDAVTGTKTLADLVGSGTTYTAGDGLTLSGSEFKIGGAAGSPATISVDSYVQAEGSYLVFTNKSSSTYNSLLVADGSAKLHAGGGPASQTRASFSVNSWGTDPYYGYAAMSVYDATSSVLFAIAMENETETALIIDSRATKVGLQNSADYSSDATDRSLIDKAHIESLITAGGTSYTFSNGLTETSGAVKLGGEFTSDIALTSTGLDARGWDFSIKQRDFSSSTELLVRQADISFACYSQDDWDVADLHTQIQLTTSYVELARGSASNGWKTFSITSAEMEIRDSEDEIGLQYEADYSTNGAALGDRWIPDKGYVDGAIAAGGGSSPWTKTSTNLSPTTAGDDILLATNTERLTFVGGSWVREGSAGTLGLSGGGADRMTISGSAITAGAPLRPDSNNFRDLGLTTHYWKDLFIKKIYVDNANAFITVNWVDTGEMTLADGNTGTHTLAELASGHKVIRIQHSDDGTTLDIADLGLGDVAWSDISIMMYVVTAFDSSAPQLHIGNSAHTATYYLAAGDPGWATTGFKTFTLGNDPNFISGDETINCQYNDSTSDGTVGDAYLYFSYISS